MVTMFPLDTFHLMLTEFHTLHFWFSGKGRSFWAKINSHSSLALLLTSSWILVSMLNLPESVFFKANQGHCSQAYH